MVVYEDIDVSAYRKVLVVGDLHGCYDTFMKLLAKCDFNPETDLVVSVGDLIDRGTQNVECLKLLDEAWFFAVKGNHDVMALDAMQSRKLEHLAHWLWNGGRWAFDSNGIAQEFIPELSRLEMLPDVIDLVFNDANNHVVVCHADYPSDEYEFGKGVSVKELVWSRHRIGNDIDTVTIGADLFIHGHTIVEETKLLGNHLFIDTGCFATGKLTAVVFTPTDGIDYKIVTVHDGKVD